MSSIVCARSFRVGLVMAKQAAELTGPLGLPSGWSLLLGFDDVFFSSLGHN